MYLVETLPSCSEFEKDDQCCAAEVMIHKTLIKKYAKCYLKSERPKHGSAKVAEIRHFRVPP